MYKLSCMVTRFASLIHWLPTIYALQKKFIIERKLIMFFLCWILRTLIKGALRDAKYNALGSLQNVLYDTTIINTPYNSNFWNCKNFTQFMAISVCCFISSNLFYLVISRSKLYFKKKNYRCVVICYIKLFYILVELEYF